MDTQIRRAGSNRICAAAAWLPPAFCGFAASLALLCEPAALAQGQTPPATATVNPAEDQDMPSGYPSLDAPWTKGKSKKMAPAPAPAPTPAPVETAPATLPPSTPPPAQPPSETAAPPVVAEVPPPAAPRIRKNEISASGDFFLGSGNVTLPFGFSLANALNPLVPGGGLHGTVNKADRTSDYLGGSISYSYGQAWYLDLAYANGSSSGNVPVSLSSSSMFEVLNSNFSIKDDWYQAYVRYAFPGLRGKRLSAYLRAGVSYVKATLTDAAPIPTFGTYSETDKTDDLLGNLGFGVGYSLYATRHIRLGLQAEGEGFYGRRSQNITETFNGDFGLLLTPVSINNDLYGGIGRGTLRFEYRLGRSGAFKIFGDGGFQAKYTLINYSSSLGSFTELLWGPYIKAGVRYSF